MNTKHTYKSPMFFGFYVTGNSKRLKKGSELNFKGLNVQELEYFYQH
nr:hypothetical protein [Allomuricauda sp.]